MFAGQEQEYIVMDGRVYRTSDMHELNIREVEALYEEHRAPPAPRMQPLPQRGEEQDRQQVYDRVDRECTEFMSFSIAAYAIIQIALRVLARVFG